LQASELIDHFVSALLESARKHELALGLPERAMRGSPERRWTGTDFAHFMRLIGNQLDDAFFGLAKSPCPARSSQFGVELMVLSGTLGEALDRYARFYEVITDGLSLGLEIKGAKVEIEITAADPSLDPHHFLIEWYATRLLGLAQWLIGHEISQFEVEFAHPRQIALSAYKAALGDQITFGATANRLIFPRRHLDRRIIRDIKDLAELSSNSFDPERRNHLHRTWSSLLKSSLRANLYRMTPLPTMEDLAKEFAVSGQTLRRGLKSEGTSYRQIKAETRREVVLNNITDTSLTLGQISVLAGFAETNGLVRAMKSWTGLSLSAFRRSVVEESGDEMAGCIHDAGQDPDHDIDHAEDAAVHREQSHH
jgi:AraC-like DNA-binding protein